VSGVAANAQAGLASEPDSKSALARLLHRRRDGIFIAPFEAGEIGADHFRAACNMGLEGLVSKRRDRPY
jgi:bifunctional non-homologous end joining protein LigD